MKKVELRKVKNTASIWQVIFIVNDKIIVDEQYASANVAYNRAMYFKRMNPICNLIIIR